MSIVKRLLLALIGRGTPNACPYQQPAAGLVRLPIRTYTEDELEAFGKVLGYYCTQDERGNILFTGRR